MINPKIPSLEEIIRVANLLDELGESKDVEILDEYIGKFANSTSDIIKYAGFWGGVWNRISGRVKRMFIDEWRDLYSVVKESQESLDKMMEVTKQEYDKARSYFKNYKLKEWREEVSSMTYLKKEGLVEKTNQAFANFAKSSLKDYMDESEVDESQKPEKELNKGEQSILQRARRILEKDPIAKAQLPEWSGKGYVKSNNKNGNIAILSDKFEGLVPSVIVRNDKGEFYVAKKTPKLKGSGSTIVAIQNAFGKDRWKFIGNKGFDDEQYYVFEKSGPVKKKENSPEDILGPDVVETGDVAAEVTPEKPAVSVPGVSEPVSTTVAPEIKMPVTPPVAPAAAPVVTPAAAPVAVKPPVAPTVPPVVAPEVKPTVAPVSVAPPGIVKKMPNAPAVTTPPISRRDPVVPVGTPSGGLSSVIERPAPAAPIGKPKIKDEKRMRHMVYPTPGMTNAPGEQSPQGGIHVISPQEQLEDVGAESDREDWERELPPGVEEEFDPSDPMTFAEPPVDEEEEEERKQRRIERQLFEGGEEGEDGGVSPEDIGDIESGPETQPESVMPSEIQPESVVPPEGELEKPIVSKKSKEEIAKDISSALSRGVWVQYTEQAKPEHVGKYGLVAPSTARGGKAHIRTITDPSVISALSAKYTKMQNDIASKTGEVAPGVLVGLDGKTASRINKIIKLSQKKSFEETVNNFVSKMK